MLDIKAISKTYPGPAGPVRALVSFSLSLQPGEFVAVQGPSGCGKTTLLLAAGGLLRPDSGTVVVAGTDLYSLSPEARARCRAAQIGFVFQQFHLVPYLSVLDNVLCPSLAVEVSEPRRRAMDLIEHFGLGDRLYHVPAELSTGERQRAALARALLARPGLLLADEPTGNLDADNGAAVLRYLAEFARSGGAVLLVTHDLRAAEHTDRICRLEPVQMPGVSSNNPELGTCEAR
jgi:ABC-type lipoprotein export system ATPase subunit